MANADAAMAALLMEDEAEKATKSKKGAAQCGQDAGARTLERSTSGKRIMTINNVDRDEILFVSHRWLNPHHGGYPLAHVDDAQGTKLKHLKAFVTAHPEIHFVWSRAPHCPCKNLKHKPNHFLEGWTTGRARRRIWSHRPNVSIALVSISTLQDASLLSRLIGASTIPGASACTSIHAAP